MNKVFKLKKFYVSIAIFAGIIFLILVNFNRVYKSKAEILVIFKSEKSVQNSNQILENLRIISQSLSFYDKVISDEEDMQDELIQELPNYKREIYWNQIIKMKRIGKSSVLQVITIGEDAYTAQVLAKQTIKSLIGITGVYYDIKNDIDIRILNPAIVEPSFAGSYIFLIFESLFFGLILAFILNYLLSLFLIENSKKIRGILSWSYKKETPNHSIKKEVSFKKIPKIKSKKAFQSFTKKAVAPENLPISDDSFFTVPTVSEKETKSIPNKAPLTHEASPEEVKERLNKLLSGQI